MTGTQDTGGEVGRGDRVAFPVSVGAGPGRRRTVYREGTVVRTWDEGGAERARVREDSGSYASGRGYFSRLSAVLVPAGSATGQQRLAGGTRNARYVAWECAGRPAHSWGPLTPGSASCWQCGRQQEALHHQAAETPTVVIEVRGALPETAYRRVEALLGEPLGRHKAWAEHYVLGPVTTEAADALCAFLRGLPIAHDRETTVRWAPRPPETAPAAKRISRTTRT